MIGSKRQERIDAGQDPAEVPMSLDEQVAIAPEEAKETEEVEA